MRRNIIALSALVVLCLSVTGHTVRRTIVFPTETRKFIMDNNLIIVEPPTSATDDGYEGQASIDSNYFYYCYDANSWMRTKLSTWTAENLLLESGDKVLLESGDFTLLE